MPAFGICGLILMVLVTVCLFQSVIAGHLGSSYGQHRRSVPESEGNVNSAGPGSRRKTEEEITSASQAAVAGLPFADRLPPSSKPPMNLFEEYMSRGLYTCTSSYLDALGKLHALIAVSFSLSFLWKFHNLFLHFSIFNFFKHVTVFIVFLFLSSS